MRRAGIWFWLSCKRYLHRISFLLILLLLPAGTFFIRSLEKKEGTEIQIAVCIGENTSAEGSLEQELLHDLISRDQSRGMFRFYSCDSEEQLKEEVASRRAECGYVFSSGLREKLDEKKYKRSIRIYSAPSTVTAELSAEVVFAALIWRYDRELFLQYVETGAAFSSISDEEQRKKLREESGALYDAWMKDGGTFRFVYEQEPESKDGSSYEQESKMNVTSEREDASAGAMLFPVRGIVSVYVFIIGLYGAAISLTDERKGLYHMLPVSGRIPCQLASILGPVALAAVSGLAALASGGSMTGIGKELAVMVVYAAAVTVLSWLIRLVCRRDAVVCCLIPFFLIGSLVFCPVIVDVGRYIPALDMAGRWFLPWYYLRLF